MTRVIIPKFSEKDFTVAGQLPILTGFPILPASDSLAVRWRRDTYLESEYIQKPKESQGIFKIAFKILYIVKYFFDLLYIACVNRTTDNMLS